jgi:transposase
MRSTTSPNQAANGACCHRDFPPYSTVQRYFYAWRDNGLWQTINHVLLMAVREEAGRKATLVWHSIGFADGTLASLARPPA